ncbi:vomeronasal type-1 receptor 4-like [Octodon degus]|uniref:Vomeronasal type-1 receptor n=1 Tax=Octodon degus TaxID=10160 RepID=A0A6P3FU07_OCTDE|nr:vomeronasal type-1 receptor 4-like [Octodon degus]
MAPRDLAIGMAFLSQTATGILGNAVLLFHYFFLCLTGYRLKTTDVIAEHLTLANTVIMLSKGISQTLKAFGIKYFSHIIRCTILLYIYRVARGVSVSTTCLLSVFQAMKISPMTSSWKVLKDKVPKNMGFTIFLIWIHCTLVNFIFPFYAISRSNSKNITKIKHFGQYCSNFRDKITEALYATLLLFPELLCSVLMIWSSCSMIFILHRHKQQVQYISRTNVSQKSSPETRATQSVLVLVCTFVSFYTLSSCFYTYVVNFYIPNWWLMDTSDLISTCFPTISPFILMRCNSTASRLWFTFLHFFQNHIECTAKLSGVHRLFFKKTDRKNEVVVPCNQ